MHISRQSVTYREAAPETPSASRAYRYGGSSEFVQSRTSKSRGFTLIELLVVIAIIGILSSVVLASLNTARAKGRDARRLSDIRQIRVSLELWNSSNGGEYPDALSGLVSPTAYLPSVPADPQGVAYRYANLGADESECAVASGACTSYILGAALEGPVPAGDIDGTVGEGTDSVNCADTSSAGTYCVGP